MNEEILSIYFIDKHNLYYHTTLGYHIVCQKIALIIFIFRFDLSMITKNNLQFVISHSHKVKHILLLDIPEFVILEIDR